MCNTYGKRILKITVLESATHLSLPTIEQNSHSWLLWFKLLFFFRNLFRYFSSLLILYSFISNSESEKKDNKIMSERNTQFKHQLLIHKQSLTILSKTCWIFKWQSSWPLRIPQLQDWRRIQMNLKNNKQFIWILKPLTPIYWCAPQSSLCWQSPRLCVALAGCLSPALIPYSRPRHPLPWHTAFSPTSARAASSLPFYKLLHYFLKNVNQVK